MPGKPGTERSDATDTRPAHYTVKKGDTVYSIALDHGIANALIDFGRPRAIQLVALVDRGHRELPIRADYVGRNIPTARHQSVQVRLTELDGRDEVEVEG